MILSENALYIKYIRLKEAGDLPHEYPYTVPALAGFSGCLLYTSDAADE